MSLSFAIYYLLIKRYWQDIRAIQWGRAEGELLNMDMPVELPMVMATPPPRDAYEQNMARWRKKHGKASVPYSVRSRYLTR